MKKIILPLFIALITACQIEAPKEVVKYVLFSGKIENPVNENFMLKGNGFEKLIEIKEDGSFSDTLRIAKDGYYDIYFWGSQSSTLYLKNGETLEITTVEEKFDKNVNYLGSIGSENNLLAKIKLTKNEIMVSHKNYYSLEEGPFLDKTKIIFSDLIKLIQVSDIPESYKKAALKDNEYDFSEALLDYQDNHRSYIKDENFKVSK